MYSSRSRKNRLLTLSFTFFTMFLIILMSQSNVNPSLNDEITENQMIDGNPQTSLANCPIFDGLYVNNTFYNVGILMPSFLTYWHVSGYNYIESWNIQGAGNYSWNVDISTRIMTGGSLFGDGTSTPLWIYSNISLGSTVPISVPGSGDSNFNVSGETTHFYPGYGIIDLWILEDPNQVSTEVWFEKSSGLLVNGTYYYGPGAYYTVTFIETNAEFSPNDFAPVLTSPSASPIDGNQTTQFNYSITYTDQDNNIPSYVDVLINGSVYPMEKINALDNNYTDGCDYQFLTALQPGLYNYSFRCADYKFTNATSVYTWVNVSDIGNFNAPILSNGYVTPSWGYNGTTIFSFRVNYTDLDNSPPVDVNVTINSTEYSMTKLYTSDNNYIDGCIYTYDTVFNNISTYEYHFNCTDIFFNDSLGPFTGPTTKAFMLFDGLNITYLFNSYSTLMNYSYVSGDTFHMNWFQGGPSYQWDVNHGTRIITNSDTMYVRSNSHSFVWTFTDISFDDIVPINVFYEGDNNFKVVDERVYNLTGFGVLDTWVLEDLTDPGNLSLYEKSTGLLINGNFTINYMGMVQPYRFVMTNSNVNFTYDVNDYAPFLTDDAVNPTSGNQTTLFTFNVTYTDQDNNYADYVNLLINGTQYSMYKADSNDRAYTDGCVYQYSLYLQPGNYNYSFECEDYKFTNSTAIYSNLTISTAPNINSPSLTDGNEAPQIGYNNTSIFTFTVNYSDPDNNPPTYVNITINSTENSMTKLDWMDSNYIDGCIYAYSTDLDELGNYSYFFNCSDGAFGASSGIYIGPEVKRAPLFDGMYINHTYSDNFLSTNQPSFFLYSHLSGDEFSNRWWSTGMGNSYWDENIQSRIVSNPTGGWSLPSNGHTLAWVYTSISLNESVLISNIFSSDHTFNVSGEEVWSLNGIGLVEVWVLEDLTTPGGIAYYEKSTGILLNGTFYSMGGGNYQDFSFFNTNAPITFLTNDYAPVLSSGNVIPLNGTPSDQYNFTVVYTDSDNNLPFKVEVNINGTAYAMYKSNPSDDDDYTDGCLYEYTTYLTEAPYNYTYSFDCWDGVYSNSTPTYTNLRVNGENFFNPVLSNGYCNPNRGYNGTTQYIFTVEYTDADNNHPIYINATINSTLFLLSKWDPTDLNYMDGCLYYNATTFTTLGNITYSFDCWDGDFSDSVGPYSDLKVSEYYLHNYIMDISYPYNWIDATDGVRLSLHGGFDSLQPVYLPFTFQYYNLTYTSIYIHTSGFLTFIPQSGWDNVAFPTSDYPLLIAPFWDLLSSENPCNIFVKNYTNYVVIEYHDYETMGNILVGSFQVILHRSGEIVFNYDYLDYASSYTCGLNYGGDLIMYNSYSGLNTSVDNFSILFTWELNDYEPQLNSGAVEPTSGIESQLYNFTVIFSDLDNNAPYYVYTNINGTNYIMSKQNSSDDDYINGVLYQYQTYLSADPYNYSYYFNCFDGRYYNTTTAMNDLNVSILNLATPYLQSPLVDPSYGINTTIFNFTVWYYDADNNFPMEINITINGTGIYGMMQANPLDLNAMDGVLYTFNTTLNWGYYQYQINCSDGIFANSSNWAIGPEVNPFFGFSNFTIFEDDFDDQVLGAEWSVDYGNPVINSMTSNSGTYSLAMDATGGSGSQVTSIAIDLSSYFSVNFSVWIRAGSIVFSEPPDGGEDLYVYYYNSSGSWVLLEIFLGGVADGQIYNRSYHLPSDALHGAFRIRFTHIGGTMNPGDWWHVDDVRVFSLYSKIDLYYPYNDSSILSGQYNFNWTSINSWFGSINYTLQISDTIDFSNIVFEEIDIVETTNYTNFTTYLTYTTGIYYWRVRSNWYNFYGNWTDYAIFNLTLNEVAPTLTSGTVEPKSGNQATFYNFTVEYTDLDNNSPSYIYVVINGTSCSMTKLNATDYNYADGCIYNYSSYLLPDSFNYTYYFNCSDGINLNITTSYNDLEVIEVSFIPPELQNPQVSPSLAGNTTLFNFTVIYYDAENNLPKIINITINGTGTFIMGAADPTDLNVLDGKLYYYNTSLAYGFYQFQINCTDLNLNNATAWILGPEVSPFYGEPLITLVLPLDNSTFFTGIINFTWNSLELPIGAINYTWQMSNSSSFSTIILEQENIAEIPIISNITTLVDLKTGDYYWRVRGTYFNQIQNWSNSFRINIILNNCTPALVMFNVTPLVGHQLTLFNFSVIYFDDDDNPPIFVNISINGTTFAMSKVFPSDTIYTDGCLYQYLTYLAPDLFNYTYFFNCSDSKYENWTMIFSDVEVNVKNDEIPELQNPLNSPTIGNGTTIFNLTVLYYDADNNLPTFINVTLNATTYLMVEADGSDLNVTDGKLYYYNSTLAYGYYSYQFNCYDGKFANNTAVMSWIEVNPFYGYAYSINHLTPGNGSSYFNEILNFIWTNLGAPFSPVNFTWQLSNESTFSNILLENSSIPEIGGITNITRLIDLDTGKYYWRVFPTYSVFNGSCSEYFTLNITRNDWDPNLNSGSVDPTSGSQSTFFNFTVIYFDLDNNAPIYVNLTINGTSYTMTKLDPGDNNYTDGCIYNYSIYLPADSFNYTYFFNCSDGKYTNFTSSYNNLEVDQLSIFAPKLLNPQVSPTIGSNTTLFNFTVWYYDDDNDLPTIVNITINATTYLMAKADTGDNIAIDGILYYYNHSLDHGFYQFQVNCSDGIDYNATDWIIGPEVNPFCSEPPSAITPGGVITPGENGIDIKWVSIELSFGSVNYTLQISRSSDFSSIFYEVIDIEETPGITHYYILIDVPQSQGVHLSVEFPAGQYFWRVRPNFGAYLGNWSNSFLFSVAAPDPGDGNPPPEFPIIIIIIIIIIAGIAVGVAIVAVKSSKSKGIKVKKAKTKKETKEKEPLVLVKPTVSKTPSIPEVDIKIGVICSNCNRPFLLLDSKLEQFKCSECKSLKFKVAYRCSHCQKVHPISKEVYIASGKQEIFDCPDCNESIVIVKEVESSKREKLIQTSIPVLKTPPEPSKVEIIEEIPPIITPESVPIPQKEEKPETTIAPELIPIPQKEVEPEKPIIRHIPTVAPVIPIKDIYIGVICAKCSTSSLISNLLRNAYKCQGCSNDSYYIAYRCPTCNKIYPVPLTVFEEYKEPESLKCNGCSDNIQLLKRER